MDSNYSSRNQNNINEKYNKNNSFNDNNNNNYYNDIQKTEEDLDTHLINEMTRPSVMNKRSVAKPSPHFFEKVLDLEVSLKRKFDLKIVKKLVKHYTVKEIFFK
jgi:hypothetical protein